MKRKKKDNGFRILWGFESLEELKSWCDREISDGNTHFDREVEYGYYDEVDAVTLRPYRKKQV